jgi:hypothetical protein
LDGRILPLIAGNASAIGFQLARFHLAEGARPGREYNGNYEHAAAIPMLSAIGLDLGE